MEKHRLFVGIRLSDALQKRLDQVRTNWPKEALILPPRGNLHLTLTFLGFRYEEEIARLCQRLEDVEADSFEIIFDSMELAPSAEHPTMIWLSGEPSTPLLNLKNSVERALGSIGPPKRSFRPHITLAKLRQKAWKMLPNQSRFFEHSTRYLEPVDSFALFDSQVVNGKREYIVLAEFPLAFE